ncbi:hypothetical protein C1752_00401 [Acaryochloris thomasi RCC1774]|uniref:SCP domain-containing protein n=1 Tax=Acaryochloris thomasi RCC1774 TaxID=1764569 RepID=A0A2W1K1G2_9CYAN|nr:CAP domain-containing protein [Acaryochloris thomasi]PZD75294.1 hypothetical protein C1752_00401 [Acaryochloris thomasi RCC1774]
MTTQQRSSRQAVVTNQAADKQRSNFFTHALLILSSLLVSCVGIAAEAQALPVRQAYQQSQTPNLSPQSVEMLQVEAEIWHRINQHRQRHGLSPLRVNEQLTQAARAYSKQMADYNFYSHTGVRGDTPRQRVEAQGVSAQLVGENLFQFPQRGNPVTVAVQGWMGSAGHRRNILMSQMAETGIGIWKQNGTYYVTQLLVQPRATTVTTPDRPLN